MRVLGSYVLIEQTMTKKKSAVIMANGKKDENFDTIFKVSQLGEKCPKEGEANYEGIKEGERVVFSTHVTFHGAKVVNEIKEPGQEATTVVIHTIVEISDIIGIE